jgi:hypothetical protein
VAADPPLTVPQSPMGLAPQRQNNTRAVPRLEVRLSTVLVAAATLSLASGLLLARADERLAQSRLDFPVGLLLFVLFPVCSIVGGASALVFVIRKRRLQFVLELVLAIAFVAYFATWESP